MAEYGVYIRILNSYKVWTALVVDNVSYFLLMHLGGIIED